MSLLVMTKQQEKKPKFKAMLQRRRSMVVEEKPEEEVTGEQPADAAASSEQGAGDSGEPSDPAATEEGGLHLDDPKDGQGFGVLNLFQWDRLDFFKIHQTTQFASTRGFLVTGSMYDTDRRAPDR